MHNGVSLTYGDMAIEWEVEYERKKNSDYRTNISASCEFNQFSRDYFAYHQKSGNRVLMMQMWEQAKQCKGPTTLENLLASKKRSNKG